MLCAALLSPASKWEVRRQIQTPALWLDLEPTPTHAYCDPQACSGHPDTVLACFSEELDILCVLQCACMGLCAHTCVGLHMCPLHMAHVGMCVYVHIHWCLRVLVCVPVSVLHVCTCLCLWLCLFAHVFVCCVCI